MGSLPEVAVLLCWSPTPVAVERRAEEGQRGMGGEGPCTWVVATWHGTMERAYRDFRSE